MNKFFLYTLITLLPQTMCAKNTEAIFSNSNVHLNLPDTPLARGSLEVGTQHNRYQDWTKQEDESSFQIVKKVTSIWKKQNRASQYLVYGKESFTSEKPFRWEIVPFQTTKNVIRSIWQQFLVLSKIIFGGTPLKEAERKKQLSEYKQAWTNHSVENRTVSEKKTSNTDPFCKSNVIKKQTIIEGEKVRLLFDHAPIGIGGEKLHFLVVPKAHRPTFEEVTKEEYLEASRITRYVIQKLRDSSRPIQSVYLFHKTGKGAGQSVPHWHMHVVFITSDRQDLWGKLTVLKKMLIGGRPMNNTKLQKRVKDLKEELGSKSP